jgi:hypothetical protein
MEFTIFNSDVIIDLMWSESSTGKVGQVTWYFSFPCFPLRQNIAAFLKYFVFVGKHKVRLCHTL